jgi:PAS domain S-box-containing protein
MMPTPGDMAASPATPAASPLAGAGDGAAFEFALEAAGIGVFDYDVLRREQRFSSRCRALWALPEGERPTPEVLEQRMHPEDRALLDLIRASLEPDGPGHFDLQHRIVLPDGRIRWIHARGRTVFGTDDAGRRRAVRSLGTMVDVTRQRVEEELIDAIRRLESPQAVVDQALAVLRRTLTVDRCAWSEFEDDGEHSVILGDDAEPGMPRLAGRFATRDFGPTFRDAMLGGHACVIHDTAIDIVDPGERAAYGAIGIGSAVAWPVLAGGRVVAGMALHHRQPRRWADDEIELVRVVAQRCQEAIHRVRAERRRAEAELRLELALNAAQIFVWETDLVAGKLHWSDNAARVIGCPGELLTDDPQRIEFFVNPDDLGRLRAAFAHCMAQRDTGFRLDFRGHGEAGAARHWVTEGRIVYDADGAPQRIVGSTQDVTERKAAERGLREREAMFESFFASAEGILNLFDAELRYVNLDRVTASFYGLTREQAIGRRLGELNPGGAEDVLRPIFEQVTRSGQALRGMELSGPVPVRGGEPGVFNLTFFPVTLPGGAPGLGCTGVEVTAMKQSEAALQEADRRKDQFLATLSHELRNPLAPIRNAAHLLAMPQLRPEQQRQAVDVIQRQVGHMALLLDDLLDVSRITQGRLALKKERVALAALVDAAVETARPLIERKGHRLQVSLPAEPPLLHADPLRVSQILSNLLNNAAKYTDPGGQIRLSATLDDGLLVVEVADDGIGIAPEALPQLFLMFSQVQGGAGRSEGGLGIGLALVRGLAELHGGRVEAHSEGPGRGSRFRVLLPQDAAAPAAAEPAQGADTAGTLRLLVVDDNRDAADSLALLLEAAGHPVRVAYDGRTALAVAEAFRPDVALLDIGLPDLSGHEVARRLRAAAWGRHMRLIALTGWGQDDDRRRSAEAGFDHHLTKPVDPASLSRWLAADAEDLRAP